MRDRLGFLTAKQRDYLTRVIIESFETDPELLKRVLPEAAKILESSGRISKKIEYGVLFQLTPVERERRRTSLQIALDKLRKDGELTKEEAIQALEDVAALAGAFPLEPLEASKRDIAKLLKSAAGVTLNSRGKHQKIILKEGEATKEVCLLRGANLKLTWDKKLLSVEVEPRELAVRAKALSIIGIALEETRDVAGRHDQYFAEAACER